MKRSIFLLIALLNVVVLLGSATTKVLIVGVGRFDDNRILELPGAITDARAFRETISSLGIAQNENVIFLENPSLGRFSSAINRFFSNADLQDKLIFYYSGHGYSKDGKTYLIPSDADPDFLETTAYNLTDNLRNLLSTTRSMEILLIMDACYSSSIVRDRPLTSVRVETSKIEEIINQKGAVLLLSSGPTEKSQEKPEGGGWFTHYLLEGLKGEAGKGKEWITIRDVFEYVRQNVVQKTFGKQNPMLIGQKDIPLVKNIQEVYRSLALEMVNLGAEGKIPSEYVQLYVKILTQDRSRDNELERSVREYLLAYSADRNVRALVAQTELAVTKFGSGQLSPTPRPTQPPQLPTKGTCILKVKARNELAKTGTVYLNGEEKGKLESGIVEILDLPIGKYTLVVDGEKIDRWEKEIGFVNEYEVKEEFVECVVASRVVRVVTEPTGARVWIDGKEVGTSTWQGRLEVGKIYEIKVMKEGYAEEVRKINVPGKGELIEIKISMQLKPNEPPAKPSNPSPVDGAVNVSITPALSWVCSDPDGDTLSYDIYFGTNPNPPLVKSNHTSTVYNPGTLSYNTTYYWRVVAKDNKGATTYGEVWKFKTLSLSPGALKWKFQTGGSVSSSPAIGADGTIYVGSVDGYLYALNPNGTLKWKFKTNGAVRSSPAIGADGTIYVGSYREYSYYVQHYLYAIKPDGTFKWMYQTGSRVWSSPAIGADGTIYVGSLDGYLYALNPNGTLKWRYETGGSVSSSPAIGADGTIYVGSYDGYLYAIYNDSPGLVNSPWPKFRGNVRNTGRFGDR